MEKRLQTGLLIALTAAQYLIPASAIAQQPDSATVSLSEVVVTGSNQAVSRNLLPYTVTTVDHAALNATGTSEVLTAISGMVPSLFVTQRNILGFGVSNGGAGHIKMRGVGGDRASAVLMMVDGQPQFAGIYSHHVADFYTKEYVDKVEVLRGPGSVLYGSNAMAGVINVITRQTQTHGFSASLTSQYGSYNTTQNSLTATARHGKLSALASVNFDRTDGKKFRFQPMGRICQNKLSDKPCMENSRKCYFKQFYRQRPYIPQTVKSGIDRYIPPKYNQKRCSLIGI